MEWFYHLRIAAPIAVASARKTAAPQMASCFSRCFILFWCQRINVSLRHQLILIYRCQRLFFCYSRNKNPADGVTTV